MEKKRVLLRSDDFHSVVLDKQGELPGEYLLLKGYSGEVKQDGNADDRILRFIISDSSIDRHRDRVNTDGWVLTNFRRDPVVLWSHDHWSPPVARALEVAIDGEKLFARAQFTPPDLSSFGDMIFRMLVGGGKCARPLPSVTLNRSSASDRA